MFMFCSLFEWRMSSRWIVTAITYARGTLHCRKTRFPCGDQLVICGLYVHVHETYIMPTRPSFTHPLLSANISSLYNDGYIKCKKQIASNDTTGFLGGIWEEALDGTRTFLKWLIIQNHSTSSWRQSAGLKPRFPD
jgi:hypothetical protein